MSTPMLVAEAVAVIRSMPAVPDDADWAHAEVMRALAKAGFVVAHEIGITTDDGRRGRLDVVAEKCGARIAIEIDARRPREKSLAKLRTFDGGRIIALRGVSVPGRIDRIDAVVPLRVRCASAAEKADKRRVSRFSREVSR
jgi:hypothetical protein